MHAAKDFISHIYDWLERTWHGPKGHRLAGSLLIICFLTTAALVELSQAGLLPERLMQLVPGNHFAAIEATLTLLLMIEIMGLVFSIVHSVTTSVGKQLEILSLILLRNLFKEVAHFHEPLAWSEISETVISAAATSLGALFIFFILCIFYRVKIQSELRCDETDKKNFIFTKKFIALGLLISFHEIVILYFIRILIKSPGPDPFETFYTLLIFSDILIVLISIRFGNDYQVAFRNSGFAAVTVFIRLALIAPPIFSALTGAGAALLALAIIYIYSFYISSNTVGEPAEPQTERISTP